MYSVSLLSLFGGRRSHLSVSLFYFELVISIRITCFLTSFLFWRDVVCFVCVLYFEYLFVFLIFVFSSAFVPAW